MPLQRVKFCIWDRERESLLISVDNICLCMNISSFIKIKLQRRFFNHCQPFTVALMSDLFSLSLSLSLVVSSIIFSPWLTRKKKKKRRRTNTKTSYNSTCSMSICIYPHQILQYLYAYEITRKTKIQKRKK